MVRSIRKMKAKAACQPTIVAAYDDITFDVNMPLPEKGVWILNMHFACKWLGILFRFEIRSDRFPSDGLIDKKRKKGEVDSRKNKETMIGAFRPSI